MKLTKDSLTQQVIDNFNSRLEEVAKELISSPPKTREDLAGVGYKLEQLAAAAGGAVGAIDILQTIE